MTLIDEVRGLVGVYQDEQKKRAEAHYPEVVVKIKQLAATGIKSYTIPKNDVNYWVAAMLRKDGFIVNDKKGEKGAHYNLSMIEDWFYEISW